MRRLERIKFKRSEEGPECFPTHTPVLNRVVSELLEDTKDRWTGRTGGQILEGQCSSRRVYSSAGVNS